MLNEVASEFSDWLIQNCLITVNNNRTANVRERLVTDGIASTMGEEDVVQCTRGTYTAET